MTPDEAKTFDRFSPINFAIVTSSLPCGCVPYRDVFTYKRWKAQGLQVKRGERGIKIGTYAPITKKDEDTGEVKIIGKRPWTSAVFCRHQVE